MENATTGQKKTRQKRKPFVMTRRSDIEINPQFAKALELINAGCSLFITGRAGTGKSTLLRHYLLQNYAKNIAVVAPTGVAALNVGGQTIHSFFGFKPDITPDTIKKSRDEKKSEVYRLLDTLIIDEISMMRADLLDCVDRFLRLHTGKPSKLFGGVQMVMIGDLYQLPPVVSRDEAEIFRSRYKAPYFFHAQCIKNTSLEFVELEKIYRQSDDEFIRLLNAIRNSSIEDEDMEKLNQRYLPDFVPPKGEIYINLTTTNARADQINKQELEKISGREHHIIGSVCGDFGKEYLPTAIDLSLKVGAQVMLLNNDAQGRWVNGTVAKVDKIVVSDDEVAEIIVKMPNGRKEEVRPFTWEIFRYRVEENKLLSETIGSFTQFPLRLSFAITIHKSQGKTFERAIIDLERGVFSHGQLYVALSRCVSLEGLVLKTKLGTNHLRLDYNVPKFLTGLQYEKASESLSLEEKIEIIKQAIKKRQRLEMVYLKAKDAKSTRQIIPRAIGNMDFVGHPFLGMNAYCTKNKEERTFNVERILELREALSEV